MAYATVDDLQERMVYVMSSHELEMAEVLLADASNKLDMEYSRCDKEPDLTDESLVAALKRITCALVSRVMSSNMQTDQDLYTSDAGAGAFYQASSFYDGSGMLRLQAEERRELGLPISASRASFVSF